jgi:light-regulated signal transduction histidine kinase (bacteriophytochrome)
MENTATSSINGFAQQGNKPATTNMNIMYEEVILGKILQAVLHKTKSALEAHRVIVRCDELPTIKGNGADFENLFHNIITIMLDHPPVPGKQYLYVQCKEADEEGNKQAGQHKLYIIQFHLNLALSDYWQVKHNVGLKMCQQIAETYKGGFIINNTNTGCLFTLSLPGKLY